MRIGFWTRGALVAVVAGLAACNSASPSDSTSAPENTGTAQRKLITDNNVLFFRTLDTSVTTGCLPTLSIGVQALSPLNFIALDMASVQNLSLTISSMDAFGTITVLPNLTAVPIDSATLGTIRGGLVADPLLLSAATTPTTLGLPGLDLTSLITGLPTDLQTSLATMMSATTANILAMQTALQLALNPAITSNALVFMNLPVLDGTNTFIIDMNFAVASSATLTNLSVFSAMSAQNAAIQSALFTVPMLPSTLGCITPGIVTGL